MTKRNIKKTIALMLIFTGTIISIYTFYSHLHKEDIENKSVEVFLKETIKSKKENKKSKENKSSSKTEELIDYIGVIEIPKIKLKKGLVDPNSSSNNVGRNIQILNPYSMPDEENHTFMLASHSGTSSVSYFNDLDKLKNGDDVFVYYKNKKYKYKIAAHYSEKKTGSITVKKEGEESIIVLTSCSRSNTKQLVYIGTLIKVEDYNA